MLRRSPGFGSDLTPEIEADFHRFAMPRGCHWSDLQKVSANVGVALQRILDRLAEANPRTLAGIFGDVAWGNKERLPEPALLNLIDAFDRLILNRMVVSNDMLGTAYEYLLRQFADESGKKAGEFFTPRAVVRLLIRILGPEPGEAVYDPACGSGGMLVETINEVRESGGDTRTLRLYGQEVNLTTAAIARMNLFLHDLEDFRIVRGDTLRDPRFLERSGLRKFDVVVANPPFSLKNWGADTWADDPYGRAFCGVPPAGTADLAWVQHMVASMRPATGRVGVVMPNGVLSRGAEKSIRQCLVEEDRLEAVIGLPRIFSTRPRFQPACSSSRPPRRLSGRAPYCSSMAPAASTRAETRTRCPGSISKQSCPHMPTGRQRECRSASSRTAKSGAGTGTSTPGDISPRESFTR